MKNDQYESSPELAYLKFMEQLKEKIQQTDLEARASLLGGKMSFNH